MDSLLRRGITLIQVNALSDKLRVFGRNDVLSPEVMAEINLLDRHLCSALGIDPGRPALPNR